MAHGAVPDLEVIRRILTGLPDFHLEVAESAANGEFDFVRWIANEVGAEGVYRRRPVALAPHRLDQGAACRLGVGQSRRSERPRLTSGLHLPAQPVDATQALNLCAGVSNCKVSRGRSLS